MKPALRTTIKMLNQQLITDPPITYEYYDNGPDTWLCQCCFEHAQVIGDRPGHTLPCDYQNFPHSATCPVVLARHIEEMLEGE